MYITNNTLSEKTTIKQVCEDDDDMGEFSFKGIINNSA